MRATGRFELLACGLALVCGLCAVGTPMQADAQSSVLRNSARTIDRAVTRQTRTAFRPTLQIRGNLGPVQALDIDATWSFAASVLGNGAISLWDLREGAEAQRLNNPGLGPIRTVRVGPDGGFVLLVDTGNQARLLPTYGGSGRPALPAEAGRDVSALDLSPDGARAVVGRTDGTVLEVTLATGAARTLHRANAAVTHVATGANGQFAAAAADGTLHLGGSGAVRPVRLSGTPSALDLASDGVAVVGTRTGAVESWSVGSGQRLSSASPHAGPVTAVAAAPGRLAVSADGTGRLARHAGGQATTAPRPVPGAVNALALRNTPNRILATSADGTVHVLDGQSFREVARMIANSGGWAVVSPEGRYDGAVDSFSDIVWATPVENLPVDRFASRYYEPGLLAKSVQPGLSLSTRPSASISQEVRLPPEVDITVSPTSGVQAGQTLTITVTALNRSDGTDPQVRLFNNGKRVPAGAIITDSGGAADGGRQRTVTYGLPAVEGSNALSAVALGWQDAESAPATATVQARGGGGGTLYLTSVGINTYRGAGLQPLTFAAKDARSVSSLFRQSIRTPYAGVRDTVILDGQATRGAIEAHLKSLRAVSPTDVVVVYLAGHGRTVDDEWYFVTADVSAASAAAVRSQGISAARLADHLRQIPAQKVLLMVDSCGSGAALTQFEGFDQRRNLDALSRAVGVHVLTAARAGQEAPEYGVLGHGLFTYAFLQAFQGGSTRQADRAPRDGQVTVTEIKGYIEDAVPVVVRSLEKQLAQLAGTRGGIAGRTMVTPVGISRGADFVLAR